MTIGGATDENEGLGADFGPSRFWASDQHFSGEIGKSYGLEGF